jgi:DNA-binding MarR family transcriptional regulator
MDPWTWSELILAAFVGVVAGWLLHSLVRREPEESRGVQPRGQSTSSPSVASTDEASTYRPLSPVVVVASSGLSPGADTAGRVITHLASLGRLGNDEVGRLGFTQKGMSEALGIRQGTLTKVLSRLEAAKVIEVDRRHVRGQPRRLNVYRLTALGESVARDLRHHSAVPTATSESRPIAEPAIESWKRI